MISSSLSRGLLTIIIGSLCITSVCASGVRHTQSGWTAHPPLHVLRASDAAPVGYAPAQIRHAYGFDAVAAAGSGQIIAIVDAYDAPKVASDLQTFTATFRLHPLFGLPGTSSCSVITGPHPCFQEVFAQGKKPAADDGWALETALDTQWAHATAPAADILLVETQSASLTSLMGGVEAAVANKARVVSMSWGGDEFAAEANYDSHFHKPGISFLASSGDNGNGVSYRLAGRRSHWMQRALS